MHPGKRWVGRWRHGYWAAGAQWPAAIQLEAAHQVGTAEYQMDLTEMEYMAVPVGCTLYTVLPPPPVQLFGNRKRRGTIDSFF
jgi:hypothetical protein